MAWGVSRSLVWLVGLLAAAAALLLAPRAEAAFLYWANGDSETSGSIGRANLDGTGVNNDYVKTGVGPCSVSADTENVYWTGGNPGVVGRANLITGTVQNQFAKAAAGLPCGVAVSAAGVFFVNHGSPGMGTIGRANLDGSGANTAFIGGGSNPQTPALNGTHIYWVNKDVNQVGRATLAGGEVNNAFIPTKCIPVGVAVDATYVYWANTYCGTIGRARLDGTEVNQDFVKLSKGACGIAVGGGYIYWAWYGGPTEGKIGRASLADGSGVNENFITTSGDSCGVAIGPDPVPPGPPSGPPAPGGFKFVPPVKCTKGCKRILVKFRFESAGKVVAAQVKAKGKGKKAKKPKLVSRLSSAVDAGLQTLKLKPTKAGKAAIAAKGKLRVKVSFSFTPTGGAATTITRTIKAKPPKPKKR